MESNIDNQNGIKLESMSRINEAADLNESNHHISPHHKPAAAPSIPVTSSTGTGGTGGGGGGGGEQIRPGGIKEFIAQTTMIGNVIAAAASQKNSSEPLPFTDYSLFDETYGY